MAKKSSASSIWTIIIVVVVVLLLLWWWTSYKTGDSGTPEATTGTTTEETAAADARACGKDLGCGNALLAACNPGSFSADADRQTINITIKGQQGTGCAVTSSVAVTQLEPFVQEGDDVNGDCVLDMSCVSPMGMNFDSLTAWLQGAGLSECSGEFKDFTENLAAQFSGAGFE